jgi:hypothetical protein
MHSYGHLRARRKRPRHRRAAKKRDELAAPQVEHAISSLGADHGTFSLASAGQAGPWGRPEIF